MLAEQTLFDWIFKALVGVLGWLGIKLHSRVDALEKERATKQELREQEARYVQTSDDLKNTLSDHRKETQAGFSEIRSLLIQSLKRHHDD
jgi:hypothetical protein